MPHRLFFALALSAAAATASAKEMKDIMVPAAEIPWVEEIPGMPHRLGALWGDRAAGPAGTLLKFPGGMEAPIHTHTADYRAVVIEGAWKHWYGEDGKAEASELKPGSYWTQTANEWHGDACVSSTPCVILLINEEPYQTIMK